MSTLTRASADPARIQGLITAHRHAQAEHRGALAAESSHALAAAEHPTALGQFLGNFRARGRSRAAGFGGRPRERTGSNPGTAPVADPTNSDRGR